MRTKLSLSGRTLPLYLMFYICLTNISCANRFEVPSDVYTHVDVANSIQTINVVHTVALSVQIADMFTTTCTAQIDSSQPPLPEPARSEAIKLCVAQASANFINSFLSLINGGQLGGQQ